MEPVNNTSQTPKTKRVIKRPNVGVVEAPKLSTSPLKDTISLKKQQSPKPKIEPPEKNTFNLKLNGVISGVVGACGIASLIGLIKRK